MSFISRDWIAGNLPTAANHRIDDLINKKGLGTEIPHDGWVLWKHASSDDKRGVLISTDKLEHPIVAYAIDEMVKSIESQSPNRDERTMVNVLTSSLTEIKQENFDALINFIRTSSPGELCSA